MTTSRTQLTSPSVKVDCRRYLSREKRCDQQHQSGTAASYHRLGRKMPRSARTGSVWKCATGLSMARHLTPLTSSSRITRAYALVSVNLTYSAQVADLTFPRSLIRIESFKSAHPRASFISCTASVGLSVVFVRIVSSSYEAIQVCSAGCGSRLSRSDLATQLSNTKVDASVPVQSTKQATCKMSVHTSALGTVPTS